MAFVETVVFLQIVQYARIAAFGVGDTLHRRKDGAKRQEERKRGK